MKLIIINNSMFKKRQIYLKSITFTKDEFSLINQRIDKQFTQLEQDRYSFDIFYSWSLFATILGIFTSYGNLESTKIFLNCVRYGYLPEVSIMSDKKRIKVCICINEKKLDERRTELENTAK